MASKAPAWFDANVYMANKLTQMTKADPDGKWDAQSLADAFVNNGFTGATAAYDHFVQYGMNEDVAPNTFFNANEYYAAKAAEFYHKGDVKAVSALDIANIKGEIHKAGMNAWSHYEAWGSSEGVNPSNSFDGDAYITAKATVMGWTEDKIKAAFAESHLSALEHFLIYGGQGKDEITPEQVKAGFPVAEKDQVTPDAGTGQTFTLTDKIDIIPSASENNSGNDLIIGSDTTLNAGDRIDGGAGNDTLTLAAGGKDISLAGVDIKNVENFAFSGKTDAATAIDVATFSELEHLSFKNFETTGLTVTTMVDKGVITLGGTVSLGTATVDFVDAATTANFTLDQLNSKVAVTLSGKDLTTVNVTGNTHATTGALGIMDNTLTTLNIDSSTAANIGVDSTKLATVNGTTSKGDVKLYIEHAATDLTVNLGAGNDEMWMNLADLSKSDKINMGAGEDLLGVNVKAATALTADHYAAIKATVDTESVGFFVSHSAVSADSSTTFTADAAQLGGKDIFLDGSTLAGTKASGSVVLKNVADSQLITSSMDMTDHATHATLTITSNKGTLGTVSIVTEDKGDWLYIDEASEFGTLNLSGAGKVLVAAPTSANHAVSIEAKGLTGTLIATGGSMNDFITAGSGGSTITGGAGADKITLGAGADKVVLGNVTDGGIDTITGFGKGDTLGFNATPTVAVKVVDATFDDMASVDKVLETFANGAAHDITSNTAAVFTHKGETYVLINDSTKGYLVDGDAVVHLAGVTADQVVEMGDIFVAAS